MPYALYIDESGAFEDGQGDDGKRSSLIAGWIARDDSDHPELRNRLLEWNRELGANRFHATEWRGTSTGRERLGQVFPLLSGQDACGVFAIENKVSASSQNDRTTYIDMLVEFVANVLFRMCKDRLEKEALPLRIYIAERKGEHSIRIQISLEYRLRALLAGNPDKSLLDGYQIHMRSLALEASTLEEPSSMNRERTGLMPELVLADFLCNELYQRRSLSRCPDGLVVPRWETWIFEGDPFWRDLQFHRRQGWWVPIILELSSGRGQKWRNEHPRMAGEFDKLFVEAVGQVLFAGGEELLHSLQEQVLSKGNWEQARRVLTQVEKEINLVPGHRRPRIEWDLCRYRIDLANHEGKGREAMEAFECFRSLLDDERFQRLEYLEQVTEYANRHAVSIIDRYYFEEALPLLEEAAAIERARMGEPVVVGGREIRARHSDRLGKILSTTGQLYTKLAARDPGFAEVALSCFDEAEENLQASFEAGRQRNYRVEAMLVMKRSDGIFELLQKDAPSTILPDNLADVVGLSSYEMLYWLGWVADCDDPRREEYFPALLSRSEGFLSLPQNRYPSVSIPYHFGRVALARNHKAVARRALHHAAGDTSMLTGGVFDTLRLRPLGLLARAFPEHRDAAVQTIQRILKSVVGSGIINPGYFRPYLDVSAAGGWTDERLGCLERDIPFR